MRDKGASIVFSSHVLGEVRALCDRVIIVARGVVVAEGSPNELCNEEAFVEVTA
jgi:sodium transport system ATP-binding protein